jgi:hypothetical protein
MATATFAIKAFHDGPEHSIDTLIAVDIQDQSAFTIEAQEWFGIGGKHLEPVRHDVLCIVYAALLAAPSEQSPREFLERDIEMHHGLQFDGWSLSCRSIRRFGLVEVSGETIEHIATVARCLNQWLCEHSKYQFVRHKIASPDVLDCLSPYFGIGCNLLTQQLPAREVRDPVVVGKFGCLGALACTGWSN